MKRILLSLAAAALCLPAMAGSVTFDFTKDAYGLPNDNATYVTSPSTITQGDVSITLEGQWRMWSDGLRVYYKNNATTFFTVSISGEDKLTGVKIDANSGAKFALEADGTAVTSWTGDAESVKFYSVSTANAAIKTITVTYGEDNIEPDPEGPEAPKGTITVAECIALVTAGYKGEATVKGIVSQVDSYNETYNSITYWISDDGTTTGQMQAYSGKGLNGANFTSIDDVKVGAKVEVTGNVKDYNGTVEFDYNNYLLSYEAPEGGEEPGEGPGEGEDPDQPNQPTGESVTFDFTMPSTLNSEYSDEGEDKDDVDLTGLSFTNAPVEISFEASEGASNLPRLYYSGSNSAPGWTMRFYNNNTITVMAQEGYLLSNIEFDGTNIGKDWSMSDGTLTGSLWTPSEPATSVTFGKTATGNNPAIKTIKVYYTINVGVDAIEAVDGEAVYYNLQGVRVANPERGLFIKVQNGKSQKILK